MYLPDLTLHTLSIRKRHKQQKSAFACLAWMHHMHLLRTKCAAPAVHGNHDALCVACCPSSLPNAAPRRERESLGRRHEP